MIFFGEEESISEGARSRQAFRDRANQTADAEALRGMGDLSVWSFRGCRKQSGTDGTYAEVYRGMCVVRERTKDEWISQ